VIVSTTAAGCVLTTAATAQERSGPVLPSGWFRLDFGPTYGFADTRFGERTDGGSLIEAEEPLGFDLSGAVDESLFPELLSLEEALRSAAPGSAVEINLGSSDVFLTKDEVVFPLGLEIGVLDWLTVGGRLPLSRRRAEVLVGFDAEAANAGLSPTVSDPSGVSDFLGQLGFALSTLSGLADEACQLDPVGSSCQDLNGLTQEAGAFRDGMETAYLNRLGFPLEGTPLGDDLTSRATDLAARFAASGVESFPGSLPLATQRYDGAAFSSLISDEEFGILGEPLVDWRSPWAMGDAEVYAHVRLLGGPLWLREPDDRFAYELGVGGMMRFGTGTPDSEDNFIDMGAGDGTTDYEGRVYANIGTGFHAGLWASARYGTQGTLQLIRRVTPPSRPFAPLSSKRVVEWSPGDYLQVEVVPRFEFNDQLAIAGIFRRTSKDADRYRLLGNNPAETLDPTWLEQETDASLTELGVGAVFTSVSSPGGRPMEARFQVTSSTAGSGGQTIQWYRAEIGLRFLGRFWGRPLRPGGSP
jgi:hypothetical protein